MNKNACVRVIRVLARLLLTFARPGQLLGCVIGQKAACVPEENCTPQLLLLNDWQVLPWLLEQYPDFSEVQLLGSPLKQQLVHWQPH